MNMTIRTMDVTGETINGAATHAFGRDLEYGQGTVSGPRHTDTLTMHGVAVAKPAPRPRMITPRDAQAIPQALGSATRIRRAWQSCLVSLNNAAASTEDPLDKVNAFSDFRRALASLWAERPHRERQFAILINRLQTSFLLADAATMSDAKLAALEKVIREASRLGVFSSGDIRSFGAILDKAGCDVLDGLPDEDVDKSA
jgi:hypothetical protein